MGITQNANILRPDSAAKNGTLSTQGALNANQIKLDTNVSTNNSNLESSPTLLRRHVILRPGAADEEESIVTSVNVDGVTLDVLDDWDTAPVSGDDYLVAYTMRDMATFSGCSRDATLKHYTMSRQMVVGTAVNAGYLGISHGEVVYMDDRGPTAPALQVNGAGTFTMGATKDDVARRGAILLFTNDADDEEVVDFRSGSRIRLWDFTLMSAGRPDGIGGFTVTIGSTDIEWARSKKYGMAAAVFRNRYKRYKEQDGSLVTSVQDIEAMASNNGWLRDPMAKTITDEIAADINATQVRILVEEA